MVPFSCLTLCKALLLPQFILPASLGGAEVLSGPNDVVREGYMSPDSWTSCFCHVQKQEDTSSGLYHKRLGTSAVYLKTNPWCRRPRDHDGGLSHLGVVRWNGAPGLHCEVESVHVSKPLDHRGSQRMQMKSAFLSRTWVYLAVDHNLYFVTGWEFRVAQGFSVIQVLPKPPETWLKCRFVSFHSIWDLSLMTIDFPIVSVCKTGHHKLIIILLLNH